MNRVLTWIFDKIMKFFHSMVIFIPFDRNSASKSGIPGVRKPAVTRPDDSGKHYSSITGE
jgi:hypothetical protein